MTEPVSYVMSLRKHVGHLRILVPSVSAVIRDEADGILLVRSRETGYWSTPGGTVELNETPADALIREVREETGLLVNPRRLVGVYGGPDFVLTYPNGDETQYISTIFECDVVSGSIRPDGDEIVEARYVTRDECLKMPLSQWLPRVVSRMYQGEPEAWFDAPFIASSSTGP